jgi:hypothetical protein
MGMRCAYWRILCHRPWYLLCSGVNVRASLERSLVFGGGIRTRWSIGGVSCETLLFLSNQKLIQ